MQQSYFSEVTHILVKIIFEVTKFIASLGYAYTTHAHARAV